MRRTSQKVRMTMPNSLKCKIKHLCHNGTITEHERDRILKALEQEPILDKIRAEIDWLSDSKCDGTIVTVYSWDGMKRRVLDIIDKYKAESEEKN